MKQCTIKKSVILKGKGLHKGEKVIVKFLPAKENTGIIIRNKGEEFGLDVRYVFSTDRGTSIKYKNNVIYTVEHMLAAIRGLDIDNIIIDINGNEPPVFDGSSFFYVKKIKKARLKYLKKDKKEINIKKILLIKDKDKFILALPSEKFKIYYFSDFSYGGIKIEEFNSVITPKNFIKQISRARTFGFKFEVDELIKRGLIKGADLKNAILIDNGKPVNTKLRYKNELTRHKVLDIIGDFGFITGKLNFTIIAHKTGHKHNIEMVKKIIKGG